MFAIHVNTQTVFTFLDVGTCTTCLRMYLLLIILTLSRYNDSSGSMILVQYSGITEWYYFFLLLAAVVVRLFPQDRDSCVLALCCGVPLAFQ